MVKEQVMAAKKLKITYQDGRPEDVVKVLPRAYAMTEAYLKGFSTQNLYAATYHLGWAALQSLGRTTLDYETWLNTIEDVEDYEDPEKPEEPIEEIPPTPPVLSGDVSSE
jgi:hypothetical protein